jgi:alpha-tubulin suppressor-like RCC1 family protein
MLGAVTMAAMALATIPTVRTALAAPAVTADSSLNALEMSEGGAYVSWYDADWNQLGYGFISTTLKYYTVIGNSTNSVVLTPTVNAGGATWAATSSAGSCSSGVSAECELSPGQNTLTVTVSNGPSTSNYVVVVRRPLRTQVRALANGHKNYYNCAAQASKYVTCWGQAVGEFGGSSTYSAKLSPYTVTVLGANVVGMSGGYNAACYLMDDTTVTCLGTGGQGAIGVGYFPGNFVLTKTTVVKQSGAPFTGVERLESTDDGVCGLVAGQVWCWGRNKYNAFGPAAPNDAIIWGAVTATERTDVVGFSYSRALCMAYADGTLTCQGKGPTEGLLGDGVNLAQGVPVTVVAAETGQPLRGVIDVSAAKNAICALISDGTVRCWGNAPWVGDGESATRTSAVQVMDGDTSQPLSGVVQIDAGQQVMCALLGSGEVKCWGRSGNGELGNGKWDFATYSATAALQKPGGVAFSGVTEVAATQNTACARKRTGDVYCWGDTWDGGIGDGRNPNDAAQWSQFVPGLMIDTPTSALPARLTDMAVTNGSLSGSWVSSTFSYVGTASSYLVKLKGALSEGAASVRYRSDLGACPSNNCKLVQGSNRITATVTPWGGGSEVEYVMDLTASFTPPDLSLSSLDLSRSNLAPAFVGATKYYTVHLYSTTPTATLTLTPTAASALTTASARTASGWCKSGACVVSAPATTLVTVTMTGYDGSTSDYVVTVVAERIAGGLSEMSVAPGALTPAFVSSTTSYTAEVPNGTTSAVVTATVHDVSATVAYSSTAGSCTPGDASPSTCAIASSGTTTITVIATAVDGTTKEYETVVTVTPSSDASVALLTPAAPAALQGTWVSSTLRYTVNVPVGEDMLEFVFTPTVTSLQNATGDSSAGGCDVSYSTGEEFGVGGCTIVPTDTTYITLTVTAEDGTIRDYVIVVVPTTPSSDANLGGLAISPGTLSPAFVSSTTDYAATVPNGTTSVVVTATVNDVGATVSYSTTGGTCTLGNASPSTCDIAPSGTTTITITITASDLTTIKTYTIVVTVADENASSDAKLGELAISPGALSPAFVSSTTDYAAIVPNGTTSAVVTATTNDVSATVSYSTTGGTCTPGNTSPSTCEIAPSGTTTITITITAADGATIETYTMIVTVAGASSDATLGDLTIDPGTLEPAFVSTTTAYAASVANDVASVQVTATPNDPAATVTFAPCDAPGARAGAGRATGPVAPTTATCPVSVGVNVITVTVTNGAEVTEYTITITRAASLTTIDRVWPGTGLEAGGMPVQIFGTGFAAALTVTVDGASVPFTIVNDGRIAFVMPPGTAGESVDVVVATANGSVTAEDAFTYVAPEAVTVDAQTGGVFTTTDGVVLTIPSQGVDGTFVLTMTPLPPEPGVPGSVLMYSFRLDALLNWVPLASLTNPVTIQLPVDPAIVPNGEQPYLYQWIGGEERGKRSVEREEERSALTSHSSPLTSLASGRWTLVAGQSYDGGTRTMTVGLRPMGVYALSTAYLRSYWFPVVPVMK